MPRGDLNYAACDACGFVFNQAFEPELLTYDARYNNAQTYSPLFDKYFSDFAHYIVFDKGVRNSRIVEVGCGNGLFLKRLVSTEGAENTGYGFDPSYTGPESDLGGRVKFDRRYYGPECADIPADVVVCRHVIEHVPDSVGLLRAVRQALQHSPHARVFFETPDVTWILRNQVIWDLFYEHCSLFTPDSLTTAFEQAGFVVERVRHVFGNQYLWLEAIVGGNERPIHLHPDPIPTLAHQFTASEAALRQEWEAKIRDLARAGKVALWGAGAKGVTLANLIDRKQGMIDCVVDLNPAKQGGYVPGTGHPIIDYREIPKRGVQAAVVMNPNYTEEIVALLRDAGIPCKVVTEEHYEDHH